MKDVPDPDEYDVDLVQAFEERIVAHHPNIETVTSVTTDNLYANIREKRNAVSGVEECANCNPDMSLQDTAAHPCDDCWSVALNAIED